MKNVFGIAFVMASFIFSSVQLGAQGDSSYVVVVNKQVQGTSIKLSSLKGIYLREIRDWGGGGGEIIAVDLANAAGFYQSLFGKSYGQMQTYWLSMQIKYSADLPVSKKDPESVKQFVAENKGAIGFLRNRDLDDRVKVLKVVN